MGTKDFPKLQVLLEHFDENPELMTSSKDKDIILVLGKKDSGKSTFVNSLGEIPLQATKDNKIILKEPNYPKAMKIGSETLFPRYLSAFNHVIYDFPHMTDDDTNLENFINICIAKHLAELAKSLIIIFTFNQEDYSSEKYEDIQSSVNFASKLFPRNQIHEFSIFVITKSYEINAQEQFLSLLTKKNDQDFVLPLINKNRLFSMPKPVNGILMQNNTSLINEIGKIVSLSILNPSLNLFYTTDSPMFEFIEVCNDYLESNRLNKISRLNVDSQITDLTNTIIKVQENLEARVEHIQNSLFTINYSSESEEEKKDDIKDDDDDDDDEDFAIYFRRYGSMKSRNSIESFTFESSLTKQLSFVRSNVYFIRCIANDAFIYMSMEKEGGDRLAKAINELNSESLFSIRLTDQGYLIQNIQTSCYLFVTKVYKRNDSYVVEGSSKYDSKSYFEIEEKNDGCYVLKKKYKN
ncbi:hypothetical protein SteCoe_28428 [Stentor coeruleus]|uniref:Uncharacterized protein n=1 Tax=Stentor coeruleus TaxID=5963 RepID=A0A1R2B8A5_9CILI|nr:hypothetical protein SteCoe_28428 [Stentor coeruleus]